MQRVMDMYMDNCIVRTEIAVLVIVTFANVGKNSYVYSSNAMGYKLQICSEDMDEFINITSSEISKNILPTYTTFSVDGHLRIKQQLAIRCNGSVWEVG